MTTLAVDLTTPIYEVMSELASCLCGAMESMGLPFCHCGVIPGGEPMVDICDEVGCGTAWVRLVSAYPATGVGLPSTTLRNCDATLGFDVEMGVLRCVTLVETDGSLPDAATLASYTELQIADLYAMRKAIACCSSSKAWIVQTYEPLGPEGSMVGGMMTIQMTEV